MPEVEQYNWANLMPKQPIKKIIIKQRKQYKFKKTKLKDKKLINDDIANINHIKNIIKEE